MAKRRRKKPNIPQAAMDHARQELEQEDNPTQETEATSAPAKAEKKETPKTTDAPKPRRRRRDLQSVTLEKRKNADKPLDAEFVADMLANPTKIVTEEDLKADYGFVIKDLRNMGILAGVLFICLVGMSIVLL